MKKRLVLLMAMVMILSVMASASAQAPAERDPDTLIVGHTTMLSGNFLSELWGSNTADIDVRGLIHEYPLVSWTNNGDYQVNTTVVRSLETLTGAGGDRTFTVALQEDLRYSDGSSITAKDYLFNFLLMASPQIRELSGLAASKDYIQGFNAYQTGASEAFSGLRLLDDMTFSVQVTAENLPYYFELSYINIFPLPYRVLAPGSDIVDEGNGALISGDFTAEVLRESLLAPQTGYISHPAVTSGPYRLVNYDSAAHVALLEINPYYKGNYEGQVPSIPRLLFREIKNENILRELTQGEVDLVNKATNGQVIDEGLALAENGGFMAVPYPREGAGFLAVAAERDITGTVLTRQAIAYLLDYDVLPRDFLKGHGEPVYGYYGLGQWMAQEMADELSQMQPYTLNLQEAVRLLEEDGWVYDAQGGAYDPQAGGLRHKLFDTEYKPLSLMMAVTLLNEGADLTSAMLSENLSQVGGELVTLSMPLDEALRQYYRQDARAFDVFFMGTNFSYLFDPTNTYLVGEEYQGTMNTSGVQDERLEELAANITRAQPGNRDAYLNRWLEFQQYWAEVLPMIPLYGNMYHDLFTDELQGYFPQFYYSWGTAILYATLNR